MSGLIGAIETALTGLDAFEEGIGTVSQNVANQTTKGYAVESLDLSTMASAVQGGAGSGVETQVIRAADSYAAGVLRTANSANAAASTTSTSLTSISDALTNNGDVQSALNQFFLDIGTLAGNPTSAAQQQTVISDAQSVVGAFHSAAGAIATTQAGATTSLQDEVSSANNLLGQLAAINKSLVTSPDNPSLLDQQESALNSLSSLLSVTVVPVGSGGQVLLASGGTVLLNQAGAQDLTLTGGTGTVPPVVSVGSEDTSLALGSGDGSIGGNLQTWQAGASALQSLNALATTVASDINTVQAQGLTVKGAQGGDLFSVPSPSVIAGSANAGSARLTAVVANGASLPVDGGPFTLTYGGSSGWTAVDTATGASETVTTGTNSSGATTLSFAGLTATVASGTASAGDSFTVDPAPGAAAALALATTQGSALAAADPYVATPGELQSDGSVSNTNGGSITAGNSSVTSSPVSGATQVPASYYGQSLQITFTSPTDYNITTTADPSTVIASGSLSGSGNSATIAIAYPTGGAAAGSYWQLPISGTPATGDVLTLTPGGSSSGSNATRMQSLWTQTGTSAAGSLQQAVLGVGTALGANAQQAQDLATATSAQVTTATDSLQTVAGVSLDQQAVLLTQYQQAYQAAAQVISGANAMFEALLQAV